MHPVRLHNTMQRQIVNVSRNEVIEWIVKKLLAALSDAIRETVRSPDFANVLVVERASLARPT